MKPSERLSALDARIRYLRVRELRGWLMTDSELAAQRQVEVLQCQRGQSSSDVPWQPR